MKSKNKNKIMLRMLITTKTTMKPRKTKVPTKTITPLMKKPKVRSILETRKMTTKKRRRRTR